MPVTGMAQPLEHGGQVKPPEGTDVYAYWLANWTTSRTYHQAWL
jgi:hypothetical protein